MKQIFIPLLPRILTSPITSRHSFIHFHPVKKTITTVFGTVAPRFSYHFAGTFPPRFPPGCFNNRLAQLEKLAKTRAWELRFAGFFTGILFQFYRLHIMEQLYLDPPKPVSIFRTLGGFQVPTLYKYIKYHEFTSTVGQYSILMEHLGMLIYLAVLIIIARGSFSSLTGEIWNEIGTLGHVPLFRNKWQ